MTTKEQIEVMQAYIDGKEIQFKDEFSIDWIDLDSSPSWNWVDNEYRIKPDTIKNNKNYDWHDLRKNPKDLPENYEYVCVYVKRKNDDDYRDYAQAFRNGKDSWTFRSSKYDFMYDVIAWKYMYLEPFNEEEV